MKKNDKVPKNKTRSRSHNSADLTKMVEKLHLENEEKYRTILENIEDGYYEVDLTGNFKFFNNALCKLSGCSKEELLGMNNQQFIDKKTAKEVFAMFFKVYKTGESSEGFDWQMTRKDGTKRYVDASASLTKDSSGKPTGFRGIIRDITERREMEEKLKRSEARYRLLADHMKDFVWLMDLNLNWTYISPSIEQDFGYTLDELHELPLSKILTTTSYKKAVEVFSSEISKMTKSPLPSSHQIIMEFELFSKDGRTLCIENTITFVPDYYGKLLAVLGEGRDVTERKQIENDLRKSEENFHRSFDDSPLGVRISTIEGETIYANKAILDIYGYDSVDELKKLSIKDRYTPESYAEWQERKKERLQGAFRPSEYDISILRSDGKIRHLHVFRKEIFWNGKKCFQVIYQDITARKQAEEKLSATLENLRQSIKATIQALGMASEIRDPYTAGHQKRVADLARSIAKENGLPQDKIEGIRMASSIHDIGKLSIPVEILSKPTKLNDIEFSIIKQHPQSGYEMLKHVESPWPLADIVHQHHERIDGSGYPKKLKGDEILIEARVMAVADVVEAMASHRPYRSALGIEAALQEIEINKGILYDADTVDACLKLFREKGYQLM